MIGLCIEAETTCSKCASPLAINALVERFICGQCFHENYIALEEWKDLLADFFKEALHYEENEATPSTVFSNRNYELTLGRQMPKFSDTKTYIDMEMALKAVPTGKIVNPKTNVPYSIRPLPFHFQSFCPQGTYLLCEDFSQLSEFQESVDAFKASFESKIIPFTCPSCAGTLEINGSERTLKCKFCATESYVSDAVWQKLHPVKTKQRFYFCFDEKALRFEWDSEIWDIVADANGILYMSMEPIFDSDDKLWIVALNPDLTLKWKRHDLKFKTSSNNPKLTLNSNNELIVWSSDRNTIAVLSTKDGAEIQRIGKKLDNPDEKEFTFIDFAKCKSIAADIDGNYIVMVDRNLNDSGGNHCYELMLMDKYGNLTLPWGLDKKEEKSFFGKIASFFSSPEGAVYVENAKDKTYQFREDDLQLTVGMDGSYYLRAYSYFAKYDRSGKLLYLHQMDDSSYTDDKVVGDKNGNAYYIKVSNSKSALLKISPNGDKKEVLIHNVLDYGGFCKEDKLAISENGTIYAVGYSGCLRTFDMNGQLIYASAASLKDEKGMKDEVAEMED